MCIYTLEESCLRPQGQASIFISNLHLTGCEDPSSELLRRDRSGDGKPEKRLYWMSNALVPIYKVCSYSIKINQTLRDSDPP